MTNLVRMVWVDHPLQEDIIDTIIIVATGTRGVRIHFSTTSVNFPLANLDLCLGIPKKCSENSSDPIHLPISLVRLIHSILTT